MDTKDFGETVVTTMLTTPVDSLDYNMCHKYRGICLILDHDNFSPHGITRNLGRREGSDVDSEALTDLFTKLGFNVVVRKNLTTAAIRILMKQVSLLDHGENDCLVCFVLTHGDHEHLYAFDGRYTIDQLFRNFRGDKCPTLVGKPKMFFVQACQGNRLDTGVPVVREAQDSVQYFKIPTYADFLISYSTLPGFYSFRNTEKGSWFIRSLVQVFQEYHLEFDLLSMMTMVSHQVAYYYTSVSASQSQSGMKQVPCFTSMLTRRVFLLPKSIQL